MKSALFWIITQQVVTDVSAQSIRSHLRGSRIQKESRQFQNRFYIGKSVGGRTPIEYFPPPGIGQLSSPFLLASAFFSRCHPISLPRLLSICFSPPFFFYHLPISSPASSSPFSSFPVIAYRFLVGPAFSTQASFPPSIFTLV